MSVLVLRHEEFPFFLLCICDCVPLVTVFDLKKFDQFKKRNSGSNCELSVSQALITPPNTSRGHIVASIYKFTADV